MTNVTIKTYASKPVSRRFIELPILFAAEFATILFAEISIFGPTRTQIGQLVRMPTRPQANLYANRSTRTFKKVPPKQN